MVWNTGRILDCKAFEWYFDDNLHTLGTLAKPCSIVFISISIDPSVMMTGSFLFHIVKMVKIHLKNFCEDRESNRERLRENQNGCLCAVPSPIHYLATRQLTK